VPVIPYVLKAATSSLRWHYKIYRWCKLWQSPIYHQDGKVTIIENNLNALASSAVNCSCIK